jgi:hypothetical protein
MKPDIKKQWIAALKSGDYEQTQYVLHSTSNGYCCLGVLCDLYQKAHPDKSEWVGDQHSFEFRIKGGPLSEEWSRNRLPIAVKEWAGLPQWRATNLSDLNDTGKSFLTIAEKIATYRTTDDEE